MRRVFTILIGISLLTPSAVYSQEHSFEEHLVQTSNMVMRNLYREIDQVRDKHPELKDITKEVLKKNKRGIFELYYRFNDYLSIKRNELYHFGVAINKLKSKNPYKDIGETFVYQFPLLSLQIVGGKPEFIYERKQFDVQPLIEDVMMSLWRLEQAQLPYQITLQSEKKEYEVGEPIHVDIELVNLDQSNRKLKKLDFNVIDIKIDEHLYNNPQFKAKNVKRAKTVLFKPLEKQSRGVKLSGLHEPGTYMISCTYLLPHNGVFPKSHIYVEVY